MGPFEVTEVISSTTYKLQLPSILHIHPVFYISCLKPYYHDEFEKREVLPPPPLLIDPNLGMKYEVKVILDKRSYHRQTQYLVKWKSYPLHDATWEPLKNLENCKQLVEDFEGKSESSLSRGKCREIDYLKCNSCNDCDSYNKHDLCNDHDDHNDVICAMIMMIVMIVMNVNCNLTIV
ncbi:12919_t:CDS:1 [Racocetra persica]|uniref:12919_t:CDS:1 n=1 Tax=Racocetra persica TaxID=160502 RepID=A0ACA9KFH0_9GLOM|nr:12919_t:CDS:1 [Racocetra persica]